MIRRMFAPATAVALALAVSATALAAATAYKGTIKSVDAQQRQLVLTTEQEAHTFQVAADAKITLDGQQAELNSLKSGQTCQVIAEKEGDRMVAKVIAANGSQQ